MRWVKKTGVKLFRPSFSIEFFDRVFPLADPVDKVKFFDWILQSDKTGDNGRPKN